MTDASLPPPGAPTPDARPEGGTGLDARVTAATRELADLEFPSPRVLVASSTGTARLAAELQGALEVTLEGVAGDAPLRLLAGTIAGVDTWIADVAVDEARAGGGRARVFPIWLAASAGAVWVLHTCAGTSLAEDAGAVGRIACVSDHVNLSGTSPLTGLGESRLGPLFPDQTRVHDPALRALARSAAGSRGVDGGDAVAACTLGPSLATPAELRWFRIAGAHVAVQGLADPLVATAHAGLVGATLCAITDHAGETADVATLVERTAAVAPALDDVVLGTIAAAADWRPEGLAAEEV